MGAAMPPGSPRGRPEELPPESRSVLGITVVGINLNTYGAGGYWTRTPLLIGTCIRSTRRRSSLDPPAMIHVFEQAAQRLLPHDRGALHQRRHDGCHAAHRKISAQGFSDPALRHNKGLRRSHHYWGCTGAWHRRSRSRSCASTCSRTSSSTPLSITSRASTLRRRSSGPSNILFASEMIGAVRNLDPETGHHFDDTKRYTRGTQTLSREDRHKVYEGNARRVYPRLDAALKARGR